MISKWCSQNDRYRRHSLLFLFAYAFLLRLPSEALPVVVGKGAGPAYLYLEGGTLVLDLARRKNKPRGSRLIRTCWCSESKVRVLGWSSYVAKDVLYQETCPVHVIGPLITELGQGAAPFGGISAACALGILRLLLQKIGVAGALDYRCHDLRRGHALDLQLSGEHVSFTPSQKVVASVRSSRSAAV